MKRLIHLALIIGLLSNCHSNKKTSVTNTVRKISTNDQAQQLIRKFGPIINGSWVKADYIEKIRQTKSPLAAADLADGITAIGINTDMIKGDSLVTEAGFENHEGGNVTIRFKPGKAPSSIQFNDGDLIYKIANGDTTLFLEQQLTGSKHKSFVRYMKVHIINPREFGSGIYQLVNEAIVTGNYNMTDTMGTVSKVNFSADGKVTGFPKAVRYLINVDLNDDVMDNLDEFIFYGPDERALPISEFTYKITGDTLKLYSMRASADSTEEILDKLKFTLVKVK